MFVLGAKWYEREEGIQCVSREDCEGQSMSLANVIKNVNFFQ